MMGRRQQPCTLTPIPSAEGANQGYKCDGEEEIFRMAQMLQARATVLEEAACIIRSQLRPRMTRYEPE